MACCWHDQFETFLDLYLERYPGIATQTMFRMLGLWSDKPVDRIGRTEDLLFDLRAILAEAGEICDLSGVEARRVNATDQAIRSAVSVSARMQSRIQKAEASLCERFGYDGMVTENATGVGPAASVLS
jgi:hypothetical protein